MVLVTSISNIDYLEAGNQPINAKMVNYKDKLPTKLTASSKNLSFAHTRTKCEQLISKIRASDFHHKWLYFQTQGDN